MPGAQTYVTAELDPGRYVAICFVPVGPKVRRDRNRGVARWPMGVR